MYHIVYDRLNIDSAECPVGVSPALFGALVFFLKRDSVPVADHGTHKVDRTVDAAGRETDGVWVLLAAVAVVGKHLPFRPRKHVPFKFIFG